MIKNLFNLKETTERTGMSRASIYRFYQKNQNLWNETKIIARKRKIPEAHLGLITRTNIYAKHIALDKDFTQLKKLVDVLAVPDSLQYKIYLLGWDWFGTVSFKRDYSKVQSYHRMSQAIDHIIDVYGPRTGLRVFFTTEPFTHREGTHIHFVLQVDKKFLTKAIIEEMNNYFKGNRIDIREYDKYKAGVYYMSKHGLRGEEWDVVGNNLSKSINY